MRTQYLVALLWITASPSYGQLFSYDFDGTLSDHFTRIVDDGQFFDQPAVPIDNELEFHNNGNNPQFTDSSEVYGFDLIFSYDESWFACIDLTIPLSYDPIASTVNDAFAAVGLAVGFLPNGFGGADTHAFVSSLDLDSFGGFTGRSILADFSIDDSDIEEGFLNVDGIETVKATITFDADEKKLRAITDLSVTPVLEIDIDEGDANDWGMTNSDYFEIFLFGNSGGADGLPITANAPLTLDNFRVGVVPEPYSAYLLAYGVLSAVALQRLRG